MKKNVYTYHIAFLDEILRPKPGNYQGRLQEA